MQPSIDDWVKENLRYDPETGFLWWRVGNKNKSRVVEFTVGSPDNTGYLNVDLSILGKRKSLKAHRIAWFLYYGVWPKDQIDHINNARNDNRIINLREATGFENQRNQKIQKGGTSKYKGVCWNKETRKWMSRITVNHKEIYLGLYNSEEEAALAYNKAALEHFGEYAKINVIEPLDTDMTNTYINSYSGELTC